MLSYKHEKDRGDRTTLVNCVFSCKLKAVNSTVNRWKIILLYNIDTAFKNDIFYMMSHTHTCTYISFFFFFFFFKFTNNINFFQKNTIIYITVLLLHLYSHARRNYRLWSNSCLFATFFKSHTSTHCIGKPNSNNKNRFSVCTLH